VTLRARALGLWLLVALVLAACDSGGGAATTPSPGKLTVVTTTTQIRSLAQSVLGDLGYVRSILPPGADPHEFEPRPSDVQAISQSAVVLKNGIGLDDWVDKLITNAGGQHALVTVTGGIPVRKGDQEEPNGDPHVWFSAANAITMTLNVRNALAQADPAHADTYTANADASVGKLRDLDKYIKEQIATVPQEQRKMVTNHDAFGYYIEAYGLTYVGSIIPSMSTNAQPSAQDVASLIQKIKDEHVKAIFLEKSINPRLAEQIAHDAGVQVVAQLDGDSLGLEGAPDGTYDGMMRYNTDIIVKALK
jgi:ABC-type Zn uptake system ZnuABC Zn-binding protein ZnuA